MTLHPRWGTAVSLLTLGGMSPSDAPPWVGNWTAPHTKLLSAIWRTTHSNSDACHCLQKASDMG